AQGTSQLLLRRHRVLRHGRPLDQQAVSPPNNAELANIVGSVSGFLTVVSFIPQAVRAWTRKQTRDLSRGTFVLLVMQAAGWTTYGVLLAQAPIIWTNSITLVLIGSILAAKLRHG
ncbi:MAG TPA: SemiSWEET family transporter, partial [Casimicrobiaceae bacterium]